MMTEDDLTCLAAEHVKESMLIWAAMMWTHDLVHTYTHTQLYYTILAHGASESYWETILAFSMCWDPGIVRTGIDFADACEGNKVIWAWELHAILVDLEFSIQKGKGPGAQNIWNHASLLFDHRLSTFTLFKKSIFHYSNCFYTVKTKHGSHSP